MFACSHNHLTLLTNLTSIKEPFTYNQAKHDPVWIIGMDKEFLALEQNETWELTSLSPGHTTLTSKWVYKMKYKADGSIDRAKA